MTGRGTIERQLPMVASELARLIESGMTLHSAIAELAIALHEPARFCFARMNRELADGDTLDEVLGSWQKSSPQEGIHLLVAACRLGASEGGDPVRALEGASSALSDRLDLADEARSLSSQARLSSHVLMALPVVGAVLFSILDPAVGRVLVSAPVGLILLAMGLGLDVLGAIVTRRMITAAIR